VADVVGVADVAVDVGVVLILATTLP